MKATALRSSVLSWLLGVSVGACAVSQPQLTPTAATTPEPVASPSKATSALAPKPAPQKPQPTVTAKDTMVPGISFGRFGAVTVYKPKAPTHAALFLSGDGGWNQGVIDMAQILVRKDYLVIGIDVPRYLSKLMRGHDKCLYPPADLQALSQVVQKRVGIRRYLRPLLVGYSSGATLAYAALAAAPAGTFDGGISLGFCPDIASKKPFCKGDGLTTKPTAEGKSHRRVGYDVLPSAQLPALWIALHGRVDQVCDLKQTQAFVAATGHARLVALDLVGHGFAVQKRWQTSFELAMRDINAAAFMRQAQINTAATAGQGVSSEVQGHSHPEEVDLPLVEVQAPPNAPKTDYLAVLISGDGGWAGLDREVADGLAEAGVPVIGLDSLQYFWRERTPDGSARDLQTLLSYYLRVWNKAKAIILGYSFGADVAPFMVSRLSATARQSVPLITLISPSTRASFEFQVAGWFGVDDEDGHLVAPELAKLKAMKRLCIYGGNDHTALCPTLQDGTQLVKLPGGHRLGDSSDVIAKLVLQTIGLNAP